MLLFILVIDIAIQQPLRSLCGEWRGKRQSTDMSRELKTGYCINILEQPLGNCLRTYLHSSLSQRRMRILSCKEMTDVKKHMKLLLLIKHQAK